MDAIAIIDLIAMCVLRNIPIHHFSGRYIANDFKQLAAPPEMPEWKRVSFGGVRAAYGKKTNLSILEQRQGLPIYKLRENLVQVRLPKVVYSFKGDLPQLLGV